MATKGCEWDGVKVSNCREMKQQQQRKPIASHSSLNDTINGKKNKFAKIELLS